MLEKGMQKAWQMLQTGANMRAEIEKISIKMRAEKNMISGKVPVGILFPPDLPKMNTNQQDNLQKNNKKKTTCSR